MRTSFSTSPSRSRVTGTPVQRLTTSATSSASTSSFKKRWSDCRRARSSVASSIRRSRSGSSP